MSIQEFPRTSPGTTLAPAYDRAAVRSNAESIFSVETMALGLVLSVALVSHAFNMFNYPLYRQDEGIVSQQAWAFIQNHALSPYTYTYDHPPFATFMLAAWTMLTAGFHTFGAAINSGRVLMLLLHLGSTFFLFRTARQLTGTLSGALVAGLLFSLSPLAVNFQRLIVVDNFMVFWLLAALYFLVCNRGQLFRYFAASTCLGLAVVTRESAIFFVPAFLFLTWRFADPYHRLYARSGAYLIGGIITLQYLLYALFKSELLPDNFDFQAELDGKATHVSLFGTLFQNYHNATPAWNGSQAIESIWQVWSGMDSILLFAGIICALVNLLFGMKYKENWVIPLMGLSYGLFLAIGGLDADYMVVAIVPFLALAIGQTVGWAARLLGSKLVFVTAFAALAFGSYLYIVNNQAVYTSQVNDTYQQALSWIKGNLPTDSALIITDALWVDLHDNYNGPAFPKAYSHWKAANDPAVRVGVFNGNYKNADYLVMTEEMRNQFQQKGLAFNQEAYSNSSLVRKFDGAEELQVRKINNQKPLIEPSVLDDSYNYYKAHFLSSDGKVSDSSGKVTSSQQANTMMMALFNNDQRTFDTVWIWTAQNMQLDNNLFRADAALATNRSRTASENYTNARADVDVAMSLLLAGQRWKDDNYTKEALYVMKGIWENEVITVNKKYYLKATTATAGQLEDQVLINLGAFSPQAFQLFAKADPGHNWMALYNDGYDLLQKAAWYGRGDYQGIGLPPGLLVMSTDTEQLRAVTGNFGGRLGDFDEEGQQVMWRVALDYRWFHSAKAQKFIEGSGWFLIKYWQKWENLASVYTNNGLPVNGPDSLSSYAVASADASILDELQIAKRKAEGKSPVLEGSSAETELMARAFMGAFYRQNGQGYWLNKDDVEDQTWGWLSTALHMNKLSLNFDSPAKELASGSQVGN
ncbi:MAG TPA: glycosyl hydrolase family 8 [Chloroflexia bacterium]|nr:glycosyl hydrolase family 8 [Chloroflexia bacterium]